MNWQEMLPTLLAVVGAVAALIAATAATAVFARFREYSKYDQEKKAASLSDARSYYERQIAELTERLTHTEERWRDVNHLLLSTQALQRSNRSDETGVSQVASRFGVSVTVSDVDPKLVFFLTPFAPEEQDAFYTAKRICELAGLRCLRGDEQDATGNVLSHIVQTMATSGLVIANITTRNPNVFYELGIAHAMGKQTILISQSIETVPFDLSSQRVVLYRGSEDLELKLRDSLIKAITSSTRKSL